MAARSVAATATIEQLRTTFNTLSGTDFGDISTLSSSISASNLVAAMNELESEVAPFAVGTITGATDLGGAPATTDSMLINDGGVLKEMTVANLFTSPTITTPTILEIDSGSTITLDATTDIVLDAGGADIILKDDGTIFGGFSQVGGELVIKSSSSSTTAITMAGAAVTIAGNLTVSGTTTTVDSTTINIENSFVFEGATDNSFETTLTTVDPTADRTLSLPNATDTLVGKATTDTLTNKTLTSPTITGPTITGGGFGSIATLSFEGSTTDSFETSLTVVDPTADRTVTMANATGYLQPFSATSTTAISTTVAELNLIDGGTARGTDAVASGDGLLVNDGGTMKMTNVDTVSTYFASHNVGGGNIVTTGALDSGSITSGFGTIDTGSSTITTTGAVATGAITSSSTITGTQGIFTNASPLVFEGSTADSFETTIAVTDPTADITITLPNQAGTVVVSNSTAGNDVRIDSLGIATAASGTAGEIRATNDVTAFYSSDISLKENIVEIPSALDMVDKIRGVFFDWKDDYIDSKGGEDDYFMRKHDVGLIAQEVEQVLPEVVGTRKDGTKAIKYDRLVPLLLQAIKELKNKL